MLVLARSLLLIGHRNLAFDHVTVRHHVVQDRGDRRLMLAGPNRFKCCKLAETGLYATSMC